MKHAFGNVANAGRFVQGRDEQQKTGIRWRNNNVQLLLSELKACSSTRNLEKGKEVHAEAVRSGDDSSIYVATALVHMYSKCGCMSAARQLFDSMEHRDVVSWNALISGYADNGEAFTSLEMFTKMRSQGCLPTSRTFVAALKACSSSAAEQEETEKAKCRDFGNEIHDLASKHGCDSDIFVQNTLIDMYAKCGSMVDARQVFDRMKKTDVVSWTALVSGYADNGESVIALDMFMRMRCRGFSPDSWTFVAALKAFTSLAVKDEGSARAKCIDRGKELHDLATESGCSSDIYVQNTLIDMYAKCGSTVCSRQVFVSMKHRTMVSWNALILGYAENEDGVTALHLFTRMRSQGLSPNVQTFLAALKACELLGALGFGREIHSEIDTTIKVDVFLVTCLVDFYAKCGSLLEGGKVFDSYPSTRNARTWNALLAGHCRLEDSKSAFQVFEGMQDAGFEPDGVTFTCILTCCSYAGLVEKGKNCFKVMSSKYGIIPTAEHYTCMVDNFARSNKLDDAVVLLQNMSCRPDAVAWMTVLGACRKWKNVEVGRLAFQSLLSYEDKKAAMF